MPEKKISRHELKEDLLVTGAFRAQIYFNENREKFVWGAAILALLVLAGIWFFNSRGEKGEQAQALLTRANMEYQSGQVPLALQDYRQLAEKYSGTSAGTEGLYYLASAYFQIADYGQAELHFGKFLSRSPGNPILEASAAAGLAACLEKKGNLAEAARNISRALEASGSNSQTPDYLAAAIRIHSAMGDSVRAREFLARLRKDFSIYREQINQALLYMGMHGIFEQPR